MHTPGFLHVFFPPQFHQAFPSLSHFPARVSGANSLLLLVFLVLTPSCCSCFWCCLPPVTRVSGAASLLLLVFLVLTPSCCLCFWCCLHPVARVSGANSLLLLVFLVLPPSCYSCFCRFHSYFVEEGDDRDFWDLVKTYTERIFLIPCPPPGSLSVVMER